jgi:hypothetical protein
MIKSEFLFLESNLVAGTAWSFTESLSEYSADSYDLKIIIQPKTSGSTTTTITATASGSSFLLAVPASTTSALAKGWYTAQAVIYEAGTDILVDILTTEIYIDKLLSDSVDNRTDSEIILANIITTLKSSVTREQGEITTPAGTTISYRSLQELNDLKDDYQARVNRERALRDGTFIRNEALWL